MHSILEFDSRTTTRHLKMLKAALSYIPLHDKRLITIYIKFSELIYTIGLYKKPPTFFPACPCSGVYSQEHSAAESCQASDTAQFMAAGENYKQLINALTELGDEKEKQVFSQISNMLNAFSMYEAYAPLIKAMMEAGDGAEGLLGILGLNSSMMDMLRGMRDGSNSDTDSASDKIKETKLGSSVYGPQTDMLQSLLTPEQQELFKNFQETI